MSLKPGFSLMEWIRLTKSGKDLAGTGGKFIDVTAEELRRHKKRGDAWIALNGKFLHGGERYKFPLAYFVLGGCEL